MRDYLDFEIEGKLIEWWAEFVSETERAGKQIVDVREVEIAKMVDWVMRQVAPTFATVIVVIGPNMVDAVLKTGR